MIAISDLGDASMILGLAARQIDSKSSKWPIKLVISSLVSFSLLG